MTARFLLACALLVAGSAHADTPAKPTKPGPPGPMTPPAPPANKVKDVEAGPLFNQTEAEQKCPTVCKPPTKWNGTWRTTKPSVMSVCGCAEPAPAPPPSPPPPPPPAPRGAVRELEAGPLYDQKEASAKCPKLCVAPAVWNGGWRTVKASVMSLCSCEDPPPPPPKVTVQTMDTSAIRSSGDARTKCTAACAPPLAWTGEWRAKGNKAATCECASSSPGR